MSLINDALRRARQAQSPPVREPATPAAEGPAFRPPLPAFRPEPRVPWLPAISLAAVGVTALIIAWNWKVHHPSTPLQAYARTSGSAETRVTAGIAQDAIKPDPNTTPPNAASRTEPAPAQPPAPTLGNVPPPSPSSSISGIPEAAAAASLPPENVQSATVTVQAPPPPPEPKLQSIIYHPQRPSAMIDGKVLFVGDKLRDLRVLAITPTGVTIASSSATNQIEL
jgi:hypothetical protein